MKKFLGGLGIVSAVMAVPFGGLQAGVVSVPPVHQHVELAVASVAADVAAVGDEFMSACSGVSNQACIKALHKLEDVAASTGS